MHTRMTRRAPLTAVVCLVGTLTPATGTDLPCRGETLKPAVTQGQRREYRDRASQRIGGGVIAGRVITGDMEYPLAAAEVTLSSPSLDAPTVTLTDAQGHYRFEGLPPGSYTVSATKTGHIQLRYGQRHPAELNQAIVLRDGDDVRDVDIVLPRAGFLAGRIVNERWEPIASATATALQLRYFEGRRRLVPTGAPSEVDEDGRYRVSGLAEGQYAILAARRGTWSVRGTEGKFA